MNDNPNLGPSPDWGDYYHRYVLRHSLTDTWGVVLNDQAVAVNQEFVKSFAGLDIPEEWKEFNCRIIAYVYRTDSEEIIQVEQVGLTDIYVPPVVSLRKILLEEFTGHTCVNCPGAALVAHDLKDEYGEQLIVVSVHAGWFAQPQNAPYDTDFRTDEGEEIFNTFEVISNPNGMVNRLGEGTDRVLGETEWPAAVGVEASRPPDAGLTITIDYNEPARELSTTFDISFINTLDGTYRICAYIVEDSIIAPQKNNDPAVGATPDIFDYVHMHMLRGSLNGTWGDLITGDPIIAGSSYTVQIDDHPVADELNDDHLYIVAFIYNEDSREIIQVEEAKLN
jgi:thiol-disulfide isomerase/thioredoxin